MSRILIVGGMGPQASLLLHQRLIKHASARGANQNHEFPAITHLSVPVQDFISDPANRTKAVAALNTALRCLWSR